MTFDSHHNDPAFSAMTLEILTHVLGHADDPSAAGDYLVEEIRELTGARCVMFTEFLHEGMEKRHQVISVNPERRREWAESQALQELYRTVYDLPGTHVHYAGESSPGAKLLQMQGFALSITVPLQVGSTRVGTMLVLGLPDETHLPSQLSLLNTMAPLLGLVVRNALLYERQDKVIQERTLELRSVNARLRKELEERLQAEQALAESEERLRFALEGANDGLWDVQMETGRVFLSQRGCEILGYRTEEMNAVAKMWSDLVHPEDLPHTQAALAAHLAGQTVIFQVEQRLRTKENGWKWVLSRGKVTEVNAAGLALRMTGTHTDITERKRAEEEIRHLNAALEERVRQRTAQLEAANTKLEASNRELEAFSYSVSHDLRAPLRGIDGWSQALLDDYGPSFDPRARQYLERVRTETQSMGELIEDMLELSRITRAELRLMPVDLSAMAQRVAGRLLEQHPGRIMEVNVQPGLQALGDVALLEIALTNLLGNAAKFTAPCAQAQIAVGRVETPQGLAFYVSDNGVGFDMAYAHKLFGAFQRLHKRSEYPGTGVGLATVQRIIHRCGGQVWAQAKVNEGATFYFTLQAIV